MKYYWIKLKNKKIFEKSCAFDEITAIFNVSLKLNCNKEDLEALEVPIHFWNLDPKQQWNKFERS